MKHFVAIFVCLGFTALALAQEQEEKLKELERSDTLKHKTQDTIKTAAVGKSKVDTMRIRLGRKSITIIDDDNNTTVVLPERHTKKWDDWDVEYRRKERFKGHYSGFEMGVNGFVDKTHSMNLPQELAWLDLKQARSWNININFMQQSIGFGTDKAGLVTGMGLEFNNFHFSNPIGLKVENGITTADSTYIKGNMKVEKTKLSTTHLAIPLLLELQIPAGERGHRIYLSGGVIGGLRIGTHTKVLYQNNGDKKDKVRDDFNIATFRYGFTARLGYRAIRLYANYYPVQFFEKGKGPELYPFSVGLVLIPFRD